MRERYKKKVYNFNVGDKVSLRIPRIDRTTTDLHRLPCIVVQRHGKKQFSYQIAVQVWYFKYHLPQQRIRNIQWIVAITRNW